MRTLFLLLWTLLALPLHAAIDPYEFDNDDQLRRYQYFVEEMRCPKCQNQNLAGSDAPIAADLRRELHRLLQENYSDREIVDYMVARYGEFILYDPPFDRKTAFLWLAPGLFALGGITAVVLLVLRRRGAAGSNALTPAEQQRLDALLGDSSKTPDRTDNEDRQP